MAKIPKRIICLVIASLILCVHVPVVHAEAVPSVLYGSSTVADIVMSYYAMSGTAVANTDWINTLYDSLGSNFGTIQSFAENGYLVTNPDGTWYATQAFEQAIENAPAYQSLGLDQIFNVSAQEAASGGGYAAATGAATLAGAAGAVGSVGVLPLLGGVTAAYWGGIAIGTLVNHLIDKYYGNIELSAPINYPVTSELLEKRFPGGNVGSFMSSNTVKFMFVPSDIIFYGFSTSNNGVYGYGYINKTGKESPYRRSDINGDFLLNTGAGWFESGSILHETYVWPNMYDNKSDAITFRNGVINGTVTPERFQNYSPDIIGPDGNQQTEYDPDSGQYQIPNVLPQVDPSVQSGQPLTLEDWLRFANSAKGNNSDPDGKTKNKKLFDDILDAIKKGVPSNPDNPDPDPDPYHPPTPTPVPDPDYGDPNPDQPDFESETDIPDPVDTGNPWVTPDLLDKFPFCIPKDMIDMVKGFKSADRTAPHISWNFKSPVGHVDYTFNLDLEDFEDVATLLRALELAAFIVGLAFATRYLIGAS